MNFRKFFPTGIVLISVFLAAVGCQTNTPTPTGINISGVITNLDEAKSYLTEDYHLQLVPGSSGTLSGNTVNVRADGIYTYFESGDITYVVNRILSAHVESDLATTPISADGSFTFQIDNLAPGMYFVVAQDFINFDMSWIGSNVMALASESGDPESIVVVEIPEDFSLPLIVEMDEVVILLP